MKIMKRFVKITSVFVVGAAIIYLVHVVYNSFYIYLVGLNPFSAISYLLFDPNKSNGVMHVDSLTYIQDKDSISKLYINNIEYYRLHHLYGNNFTEAAVIKHYSKYPQAIWDPGGLYQRYGSRMLKNNHLIEVASPFHTASQIEVSVDTIIYDKTGTFFVAFVCIEKHFDKLPEFVDDNTFDANALIGYRDSIENKIKIYPFDNFQAVDFDDKGKVLKCIKYDYMHFIKGNTLAGSVYESHTFPGNVDDPVFFESILFQKYNSTYYYFQVFKSTKGEVHAYDYPYGN